MQEGFYRLVCVNCNDVLNAPPDNKHNNIYIQNHPHLSVFTDIFKITNCVSTKINCLAMDDDQAVLNSAYLAEISSQCKR